MKNYWPPILILVASIGIVSCSNTSDTTTLTYESPTELDSILTRLTQLPVDVETRIQDEIASCMNNQGFKYVPFVAETTPLDESNSPSTDSFEVSLKGETPVDPNDKYMMSLGPAEATAWDEAFWGQEGHELSVTDPIPNNPDATKQGCQVYGASKALSEEERSASTNAGEAYEVLWQRTISDPRIVAAERNLAQCIDEEGGIALYTEFDLLFEIIIELPANDALERIDELRQTEVAANEVESFCRSEFYDDVYREVESEIYASLKEEYSDQLASAARVASAWGD